MIIKKKKYDKNFLKKVIFRLDFEKTELGSLEKFHKQLEKEFPLMEPKKVVQNMFSINSDGQVNPVSGDF